MSVAREMATFSNSVILGPWPKLVADREGAKEDIADVEEEVATAGEEGLITMAEAGTGTETET